MRKRYMAAALLAIVICGESTSSPDEEATKANRPAVAHFDGSQHFDQGASTPGHAPGSGRGNRNRTGDSVVPPAAPSARAGY